MIKDLTEDNLPKNLLEGKTIVISGAGSGIGRQASKTFSDYGANLILLSKDQEKLESLYDEINCDNSSNVVIQPINLKILRKKITKKLFSLLKKNIQLLMVCLTMQEFWEKKKP